MELQNIYGRIKECVLVNNIDEISQFVLGVSIFYALFNLISLDLNFQSLKEKEIDLSHQSKLTPFEELNLFNREFFKNFKALIRRPKSPFKSI